MMDPKEKARRMLEKSMRMPVNDVVLEVQKGAIVLKDFLTCLDAKLREKVVSKEKSNG